ncbi:MAG: sugar phosphate isomerase/epimerase, partial [Planctomycetes bacterium]|nr:sugar phosphate isomerase/epimerase [Planctomycetota bacterium]
KRAFGLNGFMSSAGKYGKDYPIWEVLEFARREGFDGIELVWGWPQGWQYPRPDETERIDAIRRFYEWYGLRIFSIQVGAGDAHRADAAARARWLEEFARLAALCRCLGCEHIGLWPGGGLQAPTFDDAMAHLLDSLRKAGDIAKREGLVASVEIEPPFIFHTPEHLLRIAGGVAHPNVKTMFDPSHYDLMTGGRGHPETLLEKVGAARIGYVHLTDCDGTLRDGGTSKHLACGDGHIDIRKCLEILWKGGYRGWIMIDAWEIPDAYDACRKGLQAIDGAVRAFTGS